MADWLPCQLFAVLILFPCRFVCSLTTDVLIGSGGGDLLDLASVYQRGVIVAPSAELPDCSSQVEASSSESLQLPRLVSLDAEGGMLDQSAFDAAWLAVRDRLRQQQPSCSANCSDHGHEHAPQHQHAHEKQRSDHVH